MDPTDDYILNSADQRWHHLIEKEPDLAAAIDLQRGRRGGRAPGKLGAEKISRAR